MKLKKVSYKKINWFNFPSPSENDFEFLRKNFSFHPLDLEDCLTKKTQRPKIDSYTDYVFLVLHFPVLGLGRKEIEIAELKAFIGPTYLVTLYHQPLETIDQIFNLCLKDKKEAEKYLSLGPGLLFYNLIDRLSTQFFKVLDNLEARMEAIDKKMFSLNEKNIAEQISRLRRNAIILKTSLSPQINIFAELEKGRQGVVNSDLKDYWGNISDHLTKANDRLEDYHELVEGLSSTLESYLTYRTNEIIKVLTIFSVVILPLTLLSGIYGMNIVLPLASSPNAFFVLSLIMISLVVGMLAFFRFRKWI